MAIHRRFRLFVCLLYGFLLGHVTTSPVLKRDRRSDDSNPLEAVISSLSARVDQLTAQMQAQDAVQRDHAAIIAAMEQQVAFTVTFSGAADVENLGQGQTLKFSRVIFDTDSAYNVNTGIFTAPTAGIYVFYMHIMKNMNHDSDIEVDLYHENAILVRAGACCTGHVSGANMATVHLEKGETVRAQLSRGTMLWGYLHTTFSGFRLSPV